MIKKLSKLVAFNLRRQERVKSFYSNFLQLKRILTFFLGKIKKYQFSNLLNSISHRDHLVSLFKALYFRLDFFLVISNIAKTGKQSRQLILHGHVLLNNFIERNYHVVLQRSDIVSLISSTQVSQKFNLMTPLLQTRLKLQRSKNPLFFKLFKFMQFKQVCINTTFINQQLFSQFQVLKNNRRIRFKKITEYSKNVSSALLQTQYFITKYGKYSLDLKSKWNSRFNLLSRTNHSLICLFYFFGPLVKKRKKQLKQKFHKFWQKLRFSSYLIYNLRTFSVYLLEIPRYQTLQHLTKYTLNELNQLNFIL